MKTRARFLATLIVGFVIYLTIAGFPEGQAGELNEFDAKETQAEISRLELIRVSKELAGLEAQGRVEDAFSLAKRGFDRLAETIQPDKTLDSKIILEETTLSPPPTDDEMKAALDLKVSIARKTLDSSNRLKTFVDQKSLSLILYKLLALKTVQMGWRLMKEKHVDAPFTLEELHALSEKATDIRFLGVEKIQVTLTWETPLLDPLEAALINFNMLPETSELPNLAPPVIPEVPTQPVKKIVSAIVDSTLQETQRASRYAVDLNLLDEAIRLWCQAAAGMVVVSGWEEPRKFEFGNPYLTPPKKRQP